MVNNNLPPESQPWVREIETLQDSTAKRISSIRSDNAAQQLGIKATLGLVADRIQELAAANAALPEPVANTEITYRNDLSTFAASTWITVQDFVLTAPSPDKTSVSIFATCTGFVRGNASTAIKLIRVKINGSYFPPAPLGWDSTGYAVAGASYSGTTSVPISIEFYNSTPASVTNDSNYRNQFRTFTMAVWS